MKMCVVVLFFLIILGWWFLQFFVQGWLKQFWVQHLNFNILVEFAVLLQYLVETSCWNTYNYCSCSILLTEILFWSSIAGSIEYWVHNYSTLICFLERFGRFACSLFTSNFQPDVNCPTLIFQVGESSGFPKSHILSIFGDILGGSCSENHGPGTAASPSSLTYRIPMGQTWLS